MTDTRERILETTWELMENQSGKGVRMSDIAKASKLSRQAIYLHFDNRTDLLIATTEYVDQVKKVGERIQPTLQAKTGEQRLERFIEFWGGHLPEIYGIAKALLDRLSTDEAAAAAWVNRMQLVREQCDIIARDLKKDKRLAKAWTVPIAADLLFATLSVQMWEQYTQKLGWSASQYIQRMKVNTSRMLVE